MTSPQAHPNQQWLEYAQTSSARKKIKAWLNKNEAAASSQKADGKKATNTPKREEIIVDPATFQSGTLSYMTHEIGGTIEIGGEGNIMYSFAKCCNPMRGDKVIGYITRGRGYIIHKADCTNLKNMPEWEQRKVEVTWQGEDMMKTFTITAKLDPDLFGEIDNAVKKHGARLRRGKLDTIGARLTGEFTIMADNEEAIRKATASIRTIPSVIQLSGKSDY